MSHHKVTGQAHSASRNRSDRSQSASVRSGVPRALWPEAGRTNQNKPVYQISDCRVLHLEPNRQGSALVYQHGDFLYRLETRYSGNVGAYSKGNTTIYFVRYAGGPLLAKPI